jgi:hypothetical protein
MPFYLSPEQDDFNKIPESVYVLILEQRWPRRFRT